jgi:hypothetical protein
VVGSVGLRLIGPLFVALHRLFVQVFEVGRRGLLLRLVVSLRLVMYQVLPRAVVAVALSLEEVELEGSVVRFAVSLLRK